MTLLTGVRLPTAAYREGPVSLIAGSPGRGDAFDSELDLGGRRNVRPAQGEQALLEAFVVPLARAMGHHCGDRVGRHLLNVYGRVGIIPHVRIVARALSHGGAA